MSLVEDNVYERRYPTVPLSTCTRFTIAFRVVLCTVAAWCPNPRRRFSLPANEHLVGVAVANPLIVFE